MWGVVGALFVGIIRKGRFWFIMILILIIIY